MSETSDWDPIFRYIGSENGVERQLAEEAGLDFVGVRTGKLRRSSRRLGVLSFKNVADAFRVPVGVCEAVAQVRRFRPDVLFATGGYVSTPAVIAGWILRKPILIHEQTAQLGLANRIAARCATRIALSAEETAAELPKGLRSKSFVTGNPVRQVVFHGDRERACARFGFSSDDRLLPTVYITGGAQGASSINRVVEDVLPQLLGLCRVIHQCGRQPAASEQDYDRLRAALGKLPAELARRYYIAQFIGPEIGDVYALADLIVGRSGAGTVGEIAALGKASLLIPLVPTGGDEQTKNAARLVNAGAAVTIAMADLTGDRLMAAIGDLLGNRKRLVEMGRRAQDLARPNAAADLARAILGIASCGE
jgi:UDP-N-acetylglucosamine--N-acetylmuramyl-(pentapeptide) pyrophosphoryl-undecaprenol N-acetylglucosamine transferase